MRRGKSVGRHAAVVGAAALVATIAGATSQTAGAQSTPITIVQSGLKSPRHLAFSPDGTLYVVEAGKGGPACTDFPHDLGQFCFGTSGSVAKVKSDGTVQRILTGLPSISNGPPSPTNGFDTLGPSDIAFKGNKDFVLSIGLGGSDEFRDSFGPDGQLLGTLVSGRVGRNSVSLFADVVAYEATANPEPTDIDSDPTGLLRHGGSYVLADAGGNDVVKASHKGAFSTVTVLPPVATEFMGAPFEADPVPTSVVRGPDGALYISQLTGFPFTPGVSNIWRVAKGSAPTVYASGLTNVTDLAFADDGSLYAVEIASDGLLNGPIGSLVKIPAGGGSQHETVAGGLFAPYGVALKGHDAYVTTGTVLPGGGGVVKIALD
jgi:hypothetical protein